MLTLVAVLHILTAVTLIFLVLLQDSKGGGMFAGGSSSSILGNTGATNLFVKLTRGAAVVFATTCILLVILSAQERKSVIEGVVVPTQAPEQAPDQK